MLLPSSSSEDNHQNYNELLAKFHQELCEIIFWVLDIGIPHLDLHYGPAEVR